MGRDCDTVRAGRKSLRQAACCRGVQRGVYACQVSEALCGSSGADHASRLLSYFLRYFSQNSGWTLPALFSILRDLRDLAFDVSPSFVMAHVHKRMEVGRLGCKHKRTGRYRKHGGGRTNNQQGVLELCDRQVQFVYSSSTFLPSTQPALVTEHRHTQNHGNGVSIMLSA